MNLHKKLLTRVLNEVKLHRPDLSERSELILEDNQPVISGNVCEGNNAVSSLSIIQQPTRDDCNIPKKRKQSSSSTEEEEVVPLIHNKKVCILPSGVSLCETNTMDINEGASTSKDTTQTQPVIYNKTQFQSMCPRDQFANQLLLAQTTDNTLLTDIGNIIYAKGFPRRHFEELSEVFCDNIMLVTFKDSETHLDKEKLPRIRVKLETVKAINATVRSTFNIKQDDDNGEGSSRNSFQGLVKIKIPYKLGFANIDDKKSSKLKKQVETALSRETLQRMEEKYPQAIVVPVKVSLADVPLPRVLEIVASVIHRLRDEDYFLMDIDVTQDNKGIFIKSELREYLIKQYGFRVENDTTKAEVKAWRNRSWNPVRVSEPQNLDSNENTEVKKMNELFDEDDYEKNPGNYEVPKPIILDNDTSDGLDCLVWIYLNSRVKVYNKFVCQLTSPGVSQTTGNHILDFITQSTDRLTETFNRAVRDGVTRLEITIYCPMLGADSADHLFNDCNVMIELHKPYIANGPFYRVSFADMWSRLCAELKNSCLIVDGQTLTHGYWANSLTKKITGTQWNLNAAMKNKMIDYAIAALSFDDLPAYVLMVREVPEKDLEKRRLTENLPTHQSYVYIDQSCYFKSKSGSRTYFTKSATPFSTVAAPQCKSLPENILGDGVPNERLDVHHVDFYNAGLIDTRHVKPTVHRKKVNMTDVVAPCGLMQLRGDRCPKFLFKPLSSPAQALDREMYGVGRRKEKQIVPQIAEEEICEARLKLQAKYDEAVRLEMDNQTDKGAVASQQEIKKQTKLLLHHFSSAKMRLNLYADYNVYALTVNQVKMKKSGKLVKFVWALANEHPSKSELKLIAVKGNIKQHFVDIAVEKKKVKNQSLQYEKLGYERVRDKTTKQPFVYVLGEKPMATFSTKDEGCYKDYYFIKTKNLQWYKQEKKILAAMKNIPRERRVRKFYDKMDNLTKGVYTVRAMLSIKSRGKQKFLVELDEMIGHQYMSNFWFEEEFQRMCSVSKEQKAVAEESFTRVDRHKVFYIGVLGPKQAPRTCKVSQIIVIAGSKKEIKSKVKTNNELSRSSSSSSLSSSSSTSSLSSYE